MSTFEEATEEKGTNTEGETSFWLSQSYLSHKYIGKYGSTVSFPHYVPLKYTSSFSQEILLCFEGQNDSAVIWKKNRKENSLV